MGKTKSFREEKKGFVGCDMPTIVFQAGIYEKNLGGFNLLQKNIGYDMNITSLKQGRGKSFRKEVFCDSDMSTKAFPTWNL
jgi:hypothetical protein